MTVPMKFYKHVLGVNKKSSNLAVLTELGQMPIVCDCLIRSLKYFKRINNLSPNKLVSQILECMPHCDIMTDYDRFLNQVLVKLNLQNFTIEKTELKASLKKFNNQAKRRIYETQKITFNDLLKDQTGKLTFYKNIKKHHSLERYLTRIIDPQHRKSLTRLRISAHRLPIELGRYSKLHQTKRECILCNSHEIGSEIHVLLECTNHDIIEKRKNMLEKVTKIVPVLKFLSPLQQIIYLTQAHDQNITTIYAEFVHSILVYNENTRIQSSGLVSNP